MCVSGNHASASFSILDYHVPEICVYSTYQKAQIEHYQSMPSLNCIGDVTDVRPSDGKARIKIVMSCCAMFI
jgi:hypothetical protein